MSLWSWAIDWVDYFKSFLFKYKEGRVMFTGIDNCGKTTLLHLLVNKTFAQLPPTHHSTLEEFVIGNLSLAAFDLGGHKQIRRIWKDYFEAVNAIVFIIDLADRKRIEESRNELHYLLNDDFITNMPILILGNKADKQNAFTEIEIRDIFKLNGITTGKVKEEERCGRPIELFMCSFKNQTGYHEGFRWLAKYL